MALDLNLLHLARQTGQDQTSPVGLYAVMPPRRAARGRADDQLILHLSQSGEAQLSPTQQEQLLTRMSEKYYSTPGSVTAALKVTAEHLNQFLFDRNLRGSGSGRQGVGLLAMAVIREGRLYLAQCGPQYAFLITPKSITYFHDPENSGRGLGLTPSVSIRYFQVELHANEYILLTSQLPASWDESTLQGVYGQGLEGLRRRLLALAGPSLNAVLIQTQEGSGKLRLMRPKSSPSKPLVTPPPVSAAQASADMPAGTETVPQVAASPSEPVSVPAASVAGMVGNVAPSEEVAQPEGMATPASQATPTPILLQPAPTPPHQPTTAGPVAPAGGQPAARRLNQQAATSVKPPTARRSMPRLTAKPVLAASKALGHATANAGRSVAQGLRSLTKRMLPDEGLFNLPSSTMIFFAIAVPVIISIVGGMVYLERGREKQYRAKYEEALGWSTQAEAFSDPLQQRIAWNQVLDKLDSAETYQVTDELKALRQRAVSALDQIDNIQRIDLQPAIRGGLDKSVEVTRLVAATDELYILNGARGTVMRAIFTGRGYDIDTTFRCSKGTYGAKVVGPLISVVSLPKGNTIHNAAVLALDGKGNRVYCSPNSSPLAKELTLPLTWDVPTAIAINPDTLNLYILVTKANQVWIYQNADTADAPIPFFVEETPNLFDVIDIAAVGNDILLLHESGELTQCTYGRLEEVRTRCKPVTYTGMLNRPDGTLIEGVQFSQVIFASPPGSSIYMLDAVNQAIYHFSLAMNFQNQYRSLGELPSQPATALAISPTRTVFLAVGNQIYYTTNLP